MFSLLDVVGNNSSINNSRPTPYIGQYGFINGLHRAYVGYRPTYMHIELQVHKWVAQNLCWDIGLHTCTLSYRFINGLHRT